MTTVVFKDGKPLLTPHGVALSQNCCCGSCCRYECIAPCCPVKLRAGVSEECGGGTVDIPLSFDGCHAPFTISRPCDEGGEITVVGRVRAVCERRKNDCGVACDYVVEFAQLNEDDEVVGWLPYHENRANPTPACECGQVFASWKIVHVDDSVNTFPFMPPCYGDDAGVFEQNAELNYVCETGLQCQPEWSVNWWEGKPAFEAPPGGACSTYACDRSCDCPTGLHFKIDDYESSYYQFWQLPVTHLPNCCPDDCQQVCNWPSEVYASILSPSDTGLGETCDANGLTVRLEIRVNYGYESVVFYGWWRMPHPVNYGNAYSPLTLIRPPENCGCPSGWTITVNGTELPVFGSATFVLPGLFDDHPECIDPETLTSAISAVATTCDGDGVTTEINIAIPLAGCNGGGFDRFRAWFRMPYPGFSTNGPVQASLVSPPANAASQHPGSVVQGSLLRLTNNSPEIVLNPSALSIYLECPRVKNNLFLARRGWGDPGDLVGLGINPSGLAVSVKCPGCCCDGGNSYTDCVRSGGSWYAGNGDPWQWWLPRTCEPCRCCSHSGLLCFQTVYERMQYRAGSTACCTRQFQYRVYDFETGTFIWGPTQESTACFGATQADCENAPYYEDSSVRYFAGGVFSPACAPIGSGIDPASQPEDTFSIAAGYTTNLTCLDNAPGGGFGQSFVNKACSDGRFLNGCDQAEVQIKYTRVRIVQDCSECVDTGPLVIDGSVVCQEPGVYDSVCRPINIQPSGAGGDDLQSLICPCQSALNLTGCGSENPFP